MRIIYMGTPEFAAIALSAIVKEHEVVAVVTQPDKPQGRIRKLVPTPVKVKAQEYEIPVYQPEKVREAEMVETLRSYKPDAIVVAAYGQILPESILSIPPYGCINIHASLLPKYRGAAPIERAIIDGETVTGVTTMYMEKGLDTATRTKQDDAQSCYASMLSKEMGRMDFAKSAEELERLIRGLNPWPCAYTEIDGKNVKIYKAKVIAMDDAYKTQAQGKVEQTLTFAPGEIVEVAKKYFVIACGTDALQIQNLQPEGKKPMDTVAYLNGNPLKAGMTVNWK